MAVLDRPAIGSEIAAEIAEYNTILNANVYTNGNHEITAAMVKTVFEDMRAIVEEFAVTLNDSKFNLTTDTTDDITEGTNPDHWFFSAAHLVTRFANGDVTTDNLIEGTVNLYYTDARADARIDLLRPTQTGVAAPSGYDVVTVIEEGGTPKDIHMIDSQARTAINALIARLTAANILT